jgi:hypothetical protein
MRDSFYFFGGLFLCGFMASYMIACGREAPLDVVRRPAQTEVIYSKDDPCAKLSEKTGTTGRDTEDDGESADESAKHADDEPGGATDY